MENSPLYKLPYSRHLPVLEEPDQQLVWSKEVFSKDTFFLYLQDFDMREENLKTAATTVMLPSDLAAAAMAGWSTLPEPSSRKEFAKTGRIKGHLFLTPCFQKVWISNYYIECLIKVS